MKRFVVGFTGTKKGMTTEQRGTFRRLLLGLGVTELHHGDCVGSDDAADADAKDLGVVDVHAHPPSDPRLRAFCKPPTIVHPPRPYLKRNDDIVAAGVDGLVATPKDFVQPASLRGQGTWTTIGYARKAGRRIWVVLPNGKVLEEPARA